jgi:hypothetical protein
MPQSPTPTQPAFPEQWLHERYRFDAAARCRRLQRLVVNSVAGADPLHIVDVGAGLGANTRYYAHVWPGDQVWTLVEQDPVLATRCLPTLAAWAAAQGREAARSATGLTVHLPGKRVEVRVHCTSLLAMERMLAQEHCDIVTANAVFDLCSPEQFAAFVAPLARRQLPLFTTLNYRAMAFTPPAAHDAAYIRLYERHMMRPQPFGGAMGPRCAERMQAVLTHLGYTVTQGCSVWSVTPADKAMLRGLLHFMQTALTEMVRAPAAVARLHQWLAAKQQRVEQGGLRLRVAHADLFARFCQEHRR